MVGIKHGLWLAMVAVAGCSSSRSATSVPDTQSLTRTVDATASRIVAATSAVFAERQISVASADETRGEVVSVPLDPNGQWGDVAPADRVTCPEAGAGDPNARLVLKLRVKSENNRSVVGLEAKRDGGPSCVLRGNFLSQLLDAIVARSRTGS